MSAWTDKQGYSYDVTQKTSRAPVINAPPLLTGLAVAFLVAHGVRVFGGEAVSQLMLYHGAVYPERFWGMFAATGLNPGVTSAPAYAGPLGALFSLVATAFLHGDWLHVIINAAIFVASGKPVYDDLSAGRRGSVTLFLSLFFLSVAGGSLFHLAANYPEGSVAIGASGGVSGLIAAVLLIQQSRGPLAPARLLSGPFLRVSAAFIVGNLILWLVGPMILGMSIAWQAHIGGYVAGALFYRWVTAARE